MNQTPPKFESVMLIDDNNIDLYVASRLISKNNFAKNILQYTHAQNALQYLKDNQNDLQSLPKLLFVDIYMPVMSGFQFMEEYEKLPENLKKHCQVYIISSSIDDIDINRARDDKNVIAFQEKPITKEFLEGLK